MKKLYLLFVALFSAINSFAQWDYSNANEEFKASILHDQVQRQKITDNHILSKKCYSAKKREYRNTKKEYLLTEMKYSSSGYLVEINTYAKNGKLKSRIAESYDDLGRNSGYSFFRKNGKFMFKVSSEFDSAGNKTQERYFWKKPDNLTWHAVSVFDESNKIVERNVFTDKDNKLWERYLYSYFPDGSKKQTVQYNRKGKVKHTWDFVCDPNGKSSEHSAKDTSKICIRYETDQNGNKIKVKEEVVKQGKICRTVEKFDINNNFLDWFGYDKHNKLIDHKKATYDGKSNETEFIVYKSDSDKIKRRVVYSYNEKGNMTEECVYRKGSTPDHYTRFEYETQK